MLCYFVIFPSPSSFLRTAPYMSPSDYDAVVAAHNEARFSSALHAKLFASIARVESRGRKKTRRNVVT